MIMEIPIDLFLPNMLQDHHIVFLGMVSQILEIRTVYHATGTQLLQTEKSQRVS